MLDILSAKNLLSGVCRVILLDRHEVPRQRGRKFQRRVVILVDIVHIHAVCRRVGRNRQIVGVKTIEYPVDKNNYAFAGVVRGVCSCRDDFSRENVFEIVFRAVSACGDHYILTGYKASLLDFLKYAGAQ